jgi:hypothetical protein
MDNIIETSEIELNNIIDKWCHNYELNYNGGKMRYDRGNDIEIFCKNIITKINNLYKLNAYAIKGNDDKKELSLHHKDNIIIKQHQVDIHIYKNDIFIAVIECKSYLDSCYYVRTCDDFKLFKKFGYNIKNYIFSLENSIDEKTKIFTDVITDNICDDIFYIFDTKRSSSKPLYNKKYKKPINKEKLIYLITSLKNLLIDV